MTCFFVRNILKVCNLQLARLRKQDKEVLQGLETSVFVTIYFVQEKRYLFIEVASNNVTVANVLKKVPPQHLFNHIFIPFFTTASHYFYVVSI